MRNSIDNISKFHANTRAIYNKRRLILDRVANSKIDLFRYYLILPIFGDPRLRFFDSVGRFQIGPGLSLGEGATLVSKVPYFTARVFAGCSRFRATTPYMAKSPRRVAKLKGGGALGTPI